MSESGTLVCGRASEAPPPPPYCAWQLSDVPWHICKTNQKFLGNTLLSPPCPVNTPSHSSDSTKLLIDIKMYQNHRHIQVSNLKKILGANPKAPNREGLRCLSLAIKSWTPALLRRQSTGKTHEQCSVLLVSPSCPTACLLAF